jgi:hypothetical protein
MTKSGTEGIHKIQKIMVPALSGDIAQTANHLNHKGFVYVGPDIFNFLRMLE